MDELVQTLKSHLEGCQDQSMVRGVVWVNVYSIVSSSQMEESEEAIGLAVALERIAAFSKSVCLLSGVLYWCKPVSNLHYANLEWCSCL